ncbi:DNA-binding GntR family transcriptional regulator [Pseudarthrobacter sp. W1I19]|uniref:GntR family transcriptional regulator n=1 Tax=Pseudarthrobacter sp. W1I19 TaxID=3042288 RepID=UPI002782FED1|nr:GntR family transcriptional regulator [Pseudarthrobacter sp. W1I19]MDQ0924606.1 DNA-binding GntR family transcriptional regulator [Pseudarthrobacter sp. W1I19]
MATKRDLIAAELRRQISTGELARGARVPQSQLASKFSTSITPVREALGLLEAEGVLVAEPHHGVRVATANLAQVKTVYLMRQLAEPYAMQRAVWNMSRRDLQVVTELFEHMEKSESVGDKPAFNEANRKFHFAFYDRCGDDGLRTEIAMLWQRYPWDLLQVIEHRAPDSHEEHRRILDAARAGDLNLVATATRDHLKHGYLALASRLSEEPQLDPFPVNDD